jgi:hypothetical protein
MKRLNQYVLTITGFLFFSGAVAQANCVVTSMFECTLLVTEGTVKKTAGGSAQDPFLGNTFVGSARTNTGAKGVVLSDAVKYYRNFYGNYQWAKQAQEDLESYINAFPKRLVCEEGQVATCESNN